MPRCAVLQTLRRVFLVVIALGIAGCSNAAPAEIESDKYDIILLPTEDFSFELAAQLAKLVAQDTGLKVRAMLNLGSGNWKPYNDASQYDPAKLKDLARPAITQLKNNYGGVLYVLLTSRDINSVDGNLRFVFAEHYPQEKISVISSARMMFGGERKFDVIGARARDGTETKIYFDVTPLYKKLEANLTSQGKLPTTAASLNSGSIQS